MRVVILDVYPSRPYRITKDSNGGYGTANDYGDGFVARLLSRFVAASADWPQVYVAYVAAELRAAGHGVVYARAPDEAGEADLYLIPSSIVCHETEIAAIRQLAARGKAVAAIGPFAANVSDPYLAAGATVIQGEPEMFFHGFAGSARDIAAAGPRVPAAPAVALDELAMPAWDVVAASHPPRMGFLGWGKVSIPILATRGCPYSCSYYCTYPLQQGRKIRARSPENIVAEMAHWQDTLRASHFIFRDPVFSIDRKHTLALCDAIERSGRSFTFGVETHLHNLDREMAERLYRAGLRLVYVGIESVTSDVLKDARRFTIAVEEQKRRIAMLEKMGIAVKAMFIFGFPSDTEATCAANIDFAVALCPSYAQFCVFTPYPGTPAYAEYRERIATTRYEDFTQWNLVYRHPNFTPPLMRRILDRAYRAFYTNPRWALKFALSKVA